MDRQAMDDELKALFREAPGEDQERVAAMIAALRQVPDQDPPRRIAFVSDKVFEPRWWQRFPAWGMASASAMLSVSILAHGWMMRPVAPAPAAVATAQTMPADPATYEKISRQLESRFEARLTGALADAKVTHDAQLKDAVQVVEKRLEFQHRAQMLTVEENFDLFRKQMNRMIVASADLGSSR